MNTLEAIKTRRSCRKYKSEQVKEKDLKAVLEAGTFAANAYGKQDPTIVAVQNPELVQKIKEFNAEIWHNLNSPAYVEEPHKLDPYYGAPTIVLVLTSPENINAVKDGSLVLGNMMLAAHEVGLGTCWINRADLIFDHTKRGQNLLKEMGLDENLQGVGSLALGYWDAEPKEAKPRRDGSIKIIK